MELGAYIAAVAIHAPGQQIDRAFTYIIPPQLYRRHLEGCRVLVPFGRSNRSRAGMVLSVSTADPDEIRGCKAIFAVADDAPVLNEEQMLLLYWLRENTFCTYYDAVRTLMPAALQLQVQDRYELLKNGDTEGLSPGAALMLEYLHHARNKKEFDALLDAHDTPEKAKYRAELIRAGVIGLSADAQERVKNKTIKMVRLTGDFSGSKLTVKQQQVLSALERYGTIAERELCYLSSVTPAVVQGLARRGIVERYDVLPEPEQAPRCADLPPLVLSAEQQGVYDRVVPFIERKEAKCFLLHGVTGSGKTSVFEALITRTLELGRSVLLLLPEIGLTPQTVRRFQDRFGGRIAVIHSGLTLRERRRSYERAASGEADLIIGTRSAVFAPVQDLGLIIMDEEGERSYKSDQAPRYDTIQVAKQRCKYHGAVLLPASATPTLESFWYAQRGIYELLEMKQRYSSRPLPVVETVDMAVERADGNDSEFSRSLHEALRENLERGEQSILLLNRRGYHTIISCCICNQPVYCDSCSVPMTYHRSDDNLHCHYCGAIRRMPERCPTCGGEHLRRMGFGTQRLEDELATRFPDARILRMDADTTGSRHAYEKSFEAFRKGEYDIMLGTQMIGKGLDFPNVTLVGVMSVDQALFSGDFRSYERTFSLITQVVGRGGRGDRPGRAILQTFLPDHYVLSLAAAQDYAGFCREELAIRKQLLFPPFCDICVIGLSAETLPEVQSGADAFIRCLQESLAQQPEKLPLRVLGPVPCTYNKIGGRYRFRIIIKCKNTRQFRKFLRDALQIAGSVRELAKVRCYADMNGSIGV